MIRLTNNQINKLLGALPQSYWDNFKGADNRGRFELVKELRDFIEYISMRSDKAEFVKKTFGVDIDAG